MRPDSPHKLGRRRSTTWDHISNVAIELFAARGFDEVSVDDVAEAAGIGRRTLCRYYPSKNALPWGDFDAHLAHMRDLLSGLDPDVPIGDALRAALLAFNSFDEQETARHRQRMRVILETAALQAYSMTMYGGWRAVVAAFVAQRHEARMHLRRNRARMRAARPIFRPQPCLRKPFGQIFDDGQRIRDRDVAIDQRRHLARTRKAQDAVLVRLAIGVERDEHFLEGDVVGAQRQPWPHRP